MSLSARVPVVVETRYSILRLSEADMVDLASGFVPPTVKANVIDQLDAQRNLERNAAKPVRLRKVRA